MATKAAQSQPVRRIQGDGAGAWDEPGIRTLHMGRLRICGPSLTTVNA